MSTNGAWHVYVLRDPRDGAVRYVGATTNPSLRLERHTWDRCGNVAKDAWGDELRAADLRPVMELVESHDVAPDPFTRRAREAHWIKFHLDAGAALLNRALVASTEHSLRNANRHLRYVAEGKCRQCLKPRGESRSTIYCEPCADRQRERSAASRLARRAAGGAA